MQLLHQLRLFPHVFTPHEACAAVLADDFGAPCSSTISAGHQLLAAQGAEVSWLLWALQGVTTCCQAFQ